MGAIKVKNGERGRKIPEIRGSSGKKPVWIPETDVSALGASIEYRGRGTRPRDMRYDLY